jgi:hypothetical protein
VIRIKRRAGDDQRPAAIPHRRSEGSDAFHATARVADRGRSVRTKITKRRQTVRAKRWAATTKIQRQSRIDEANDRMHFTPHHELPTVDDPSGRTLRTKMTANRRRTTSIKHWAGASKRPAKIPHRRSEGSDAFHAAARASYRPWTIRPDEPCGPK